MSDSSDDDDGVAAPPDARGSSRLRRAAGLRGGEAPDGGRGRGNRFTARLSCRRVTSTPSTRACSMAWRCRFLTARGPARPSSPRNDAPNALVSHRRGPPCRRKITELVREARDGKAPGAPAGRRSIALGSQARATVQVGIRQGRAPIESDRSVVVWSNRAGRRESRPVSRMSKAPASSSSSSST